MSFDRRDADHESGRAKQAEDAAYRLRRLGYQDDAKRLERKAAEQRRWADRMRGGEGQP